MSRFIPPNENIDHQRCDVSFPDDSLREKWWDWLENNPKEMAIHKKDSPYTFDDWIGKGVIKPGDTIQWQHLNVLEMDDKGNWTKTEITYTSKVHTIKESVYQDTAKDRIPSRGPGFVCIKTPAALDIYELFVESNKGLTITKIGTITGLSRNTVYRFCKYLIWHDWLKREDDLSYTVLDSGSFGQHVELFRDMND